MKGITKAKVLSCLVVVAILMSVVPWAGVAQDVSNRSDDLLDDYTLSSDTANLDGKYIIISSSEVPTYEFLTYANFGSDNSCYTPGQGVGGYENRLYVARGDVCYVYNVSIPEGEDPDTHPNNPEAPGPMATRSLNLIETYNFAADCGWSGGHHAEFYVEENYIYYGPDRYGVGGIEKWAKNPDGTFGAYHGRVKDKNGNPIPVPPINGETFTYDPATNAWYTCTRGRAVYSFDMDADTSWQYEFTYPTYEGSHHDGLEFVNGFLWISDMTTNWIGQWKKNPDGSWEEVARFYYDNPIEDDVEGMGFGPLGHLWVTGWNRLYEIGGKELGVVIKGIKLSMMLDKDEYSPNEIMKIYAMVTGEDGSILHPIEDKTKVKIDDNEVSIEEFTRQPKGEVVLKVNAPSDGGEHTVLMQVETDMGFADNSTTFTVFEPFTFVHMTDVHMGWKTTVWIPWPVTLTAEQILSAAIDEMNDIKPDFILDTGDIADWADDGHYRRYLEALESLEDSKVYTVPGNHDRRKTVAGPSNPKYLDHYNKLINPKRPESYTDLISPNNYTFEHNGYLFIGLDSGEDYNVWSSLPFDASPEGSGLNDDQMKELMSPDLDITVPKIIFMHHPTINSEDDEDGWGPENPVPPNGPGGNDACIAHKRSEFIDYCDDNKVSLVLTGHTHEEKVFDADGGRVNGNEWEKPLWPLFIQTPSLTKDEERHGYREISIESDKITQKYHQMGSYSSFILRVASPITLHAYDSQGRHTGINVTFGESERNIPRSFYFSGYTFETINEANETINETMPETIALYDVSQDYLFKVIANLTEEQKASPEIEHFNFTVERQTTNGSLTIIFYSNISLFENTTAILPFNLTTTNYAMEMDYNGDEIIDETKSPDAIKVDYAPKAEIISPINNSTYLCGEEIAFTGTGTDPEDGLLTNESLVWFSDIDSVIGIGNEFSESNLSVGRHNITLRVNDTLDQMNTSTVSIFIRSTQPDMFVDILKSDETPGIEQHTGVIETLADEPCNLTVYIRNTGYGTLNNVQILTNVNVTKDVGNINEGEEKLVSVQFTPTIPGLIGLNATVKSDEIDKNVTRTLLVEKFDFIVSIPKTEYNQSEPIPVNISVTSEVPNMRFIDLKIEINISSNPFNQTFDIPLLSLAPFVTKNITFTWDTTGVNNGTYTIATSLVMADREVRSDEKQICLGIEINAAPIADANGPYIGNEGSPITFNGSGSYDPNDYIVSWLWDLDGDGIYETNATESNGTVNHTWGNGYFGNVNLKVTDSFGATDTDNTTVTVLNVPPAVNAGPDKEVIAGDIVSFNGSFIDPGNDTHAIEWDFGDGTTAIGTLTLTHIYYDKRVYNVTLTITDDDGGVGTDTSIITVNPIPANVTIKPETLNFKSKGLFTAFISLPEPYNITGINISTAVCEGAPAVKGMAADNNKYIAKFDREDLREDLPTGDEVERTVTGKVFYNGDYADFEGRDTVRVIDKGEGK